MTCEFSVRHYIETVDEYRKAGYKLIQVKDLSNVNNDDKYLLIRHDVDLSLIAAMSLAAYEFVNNIKSSYFILLYSPIYNALSPTSIEAIKQIVKYQHQIGLHVDTRYEINSIADDMRTLGHITGTKIDSYVQHFINETPEIIYPAATDGLRDAIKARFKYLSDSCMNWREGCFCQHIDKYKRLTVAVHPEWQVFEGSRSKKIDTARDIEIARIDRETWDWKDTQVNYLKQFGKIGINA